MPASFFRTDGIPTPTFKMLEEKLGIVTTQEEDSVEDTSDDAYAERHCRFELREKIDGVLDTGGTSAKELKTDGRLVVNSMWSALLTAVIATLRAEVVVVVQFDGPVHCVEHGCEWFINAESKLGGRQ